MHKLHPSVKSVWMIRSALFWGICLLIALAWSIYQVIPWPGQVPTRVTLILGTIVALGILWAGVYPIVRYRFWRYELRAEDLRLIRGIWRRVDTIVPLRRIQHLDISQDVFERNFDLGSLVVHTAGTRSSSVTLPGLQHEEAARLRDELKQFIIEPAV